jgi:hypothetical protein
MDTIPEFGFGETCTVIAGDMAKALSERHGETLQQQAVRTQAVMHMIMSFAPRQVIEAMLASHCVMFHELMVDCVRDLLHAGVEQVRRGAVNNLITLNKSFCGNLDTLKDYQLRSAEGRRDAPGHVQPEPRLTEPRPSAPRLPADMSAGRREPVVPSGTPEGPAPEAADVPSLDEIAAIYHPTMELLAACRANPEAMSALATGDAAAFAHAMGVDEPSEAFLAAANTPGSPFDRQAAGPWPAGTWPEQRER